MRHHVFSVAAALLALGRPSYGANIIGRNGYGVMEVPDVLDVLMRRDSVCGANSHNCGEVGLTSNCCHNTQRCFVGTGTTNVASCCATGSPCSSDPCRSQSNAYYCPSFSTDDSGTVSTIGQCCQRICSSGSYLCPAASGSASAADMCCPYGWDCGASQCLGTATTTTSSTTSSAATGTGCPSGQQTCANGADGCCSNDAVCSTSAGKVYCSDAASAGGSKSLSAGAKAGIAIGAIAGAGLLGFVAFVMYRKYQQRKDMSEYESQEHELHDAWAGRNARDPDDLSSGIPMSPTRPTGTTQYRGLRDLVQTQPVQETPVSPNVPPVPKPNPVEMDVPETTEFRFELEGCVPELDSIAVPEDMVIANAAANKESSGIGGVTVHGGRESEDSEGAKDAVSPLSPGSPMATPTMNIIPATPISPNGDDPLHGDEQPGPHLETGETAVVDANAGNPDTEDAEAVVAQVPQKTEAAEDNKEATKEPKGPKEEAADKSA